jgi:ABC-2 type transport system permease protein
MLRETWSVTLKEIKILLQRPGELAVIFLVPFAFIWIMGTIFGRSATPTIAIFAVNEDSSASATQAMDLLRTSTSLELEILPSRAEADLKVGQGVRMAAVIIPLGYGKALSSPEGAKIEVMLDPAKSEKGKIVLGLVNQAIAQQIVDAEVNRGVSQSVANAFGSGVSLPGGVSMEQFQAFMTAGIKGAVASQVQEAMNNPLVKVELTAVEGSRTTRSPNLMEYLVPGYSLMFLFFLVNNMASTVLTERQTGTLRRLLVTPVHRSAILLGKVLPYVGMAAVQLTVVMLVSSVVFGVNLGTSPLALAIVILSAALTVGAFGIMMAALMRTEGQVSGLTSLIVMVMAVGSGAMFPNIRIPIFEYATPHYWAIQGFQNVVSRGQGIEGTLLPCGVLLVISAVFFFIGVRRFKFE